MPRLPQPGADSGTWGDILNDFLMQVHKVDGTLKDSSIPVTAIADATITEVKLSAGVQAKLNATAPVLSVAGKTGAVSLVKSDVGLANVDNTSDATKNSATATLTNKTLQSPNIDKLANLTANGVVTTSGNDGTLGVSTLPQDATKYLDGFGNFTSPLTVLVDRGDFAPSTMYTQGDIVTHQYARWYRKTTGSGGASFTAAEWIHLGLYAVGTTSDPGNGMLWIDIS